MVLWKGGGGKERKFSPITTRISGLDISITWVLGGNPYERKIRGPEEDKFFNVEFLPRSTLSSYSGA